MRKVLIVALAASSLIFPLPVRAQSATTASSAKIASQNSLPESVTVKPEIRAKLASTRVSLTLNGESSETALQKLLEETKCSYEYDPAFYRTSVSVAGVQGGGFGGGGLTGQQGGSAMDLPPRSITMKLLNAAVPKALDSLTQAIGVGWTADEEDGSITIKIVKLRGTRTTYDAAFSRFNTFGQVTGTYPSVASTYSPATANDTVYSLFFNHAVPDTRVKLDAKNWSVRDALKQVLQDAKMDFAIDDDVSNDLKRNLGFENVLLGTALDVICQSSDIGWRSENTSKGLLIRVSKRYARSTDPIKGTDGSK